MSYEISPAEELAGPPQAFAPIGDHERISSIDVLRYPGRHCGETRWLYHRAGAGHLWPWTLYNTLEYYQLYYVVFWVWIFNLTWSKPWLHYFKFCVHSSG